MTSGTKLNTKSDKSAASDKSPYDRANAFSRFFFIWVETFLHTCFRKKNLSLDDMFPLTKDEDSQVLTERTNQYWIEECRKPNPSLARALIRTFGWEYSQSIILYIIQETAVISNPLVLSYLVDQYRNLEVNFTSAVLYTILLCIISIIMSVIHHPIMFLIMRVGMRARLACSGLIYQKIMRMNQKAMSQTTTGQIVNMLSTDVQRFDTGLLFANFLWIGPVQVIVVVAVLYRAMGLASVAGVMTLVLFIPIQTFLGRMFGKFRLKTAVQSDERVKIVSEVLYGIRVVKSFCLEYFFAERVKKVRDRQLGHVRHRQLVRCTIQLIQFNISKIVLLVVVSVSCFLRRSHCPSNTDSSNVIITAPHPPPCVTAVALTEQIWPIATLLELCRTTFVTRFILSITTLSELAACVQRLQKFLLLSEEGVDNERVKSLPETKSLDVPDHPADMTLDKKNGPPSFQFDNFTATWDKNHSTKKTLTSVTLQVQGPQLIAVIGPVGAGKTSLLMSILKELTPQEGFVQVQGEVAFAAQQPWILSKTLRENIIFGSTFEPTRYQRTVRACALLSDFRTFPSGDQSLVGERGTTLSGGQKARVALARTVYSQADLVLLDDPLAAVDARVAEHIFHRCIRELMREKLCILVTHQVQFLPFVQRVIVLHEGRILFDGTFEALQASGLDYTKLCHQKETITEVPIEELVELPVPSEVPEQVDIPDFKFPSKEGRVDADGEVTVGHDEDEEELLNGKMLEFTPEVAAEEQQAQGTVKWRHYGHYFLAGGNILCLIIVVLLYIGTMIVYISSEYWLAVWANYESTRAANQSQVDSMNSSGTSLWIYNHSTSEGHWYQRIGNFTPTAENVTDVMFVPADQSHYFLSVFACLCLGIVVLSTLRNLSLYTLCLRACRNLHARMFNRLLRAPMRFFDSNPSGRILNRYSKDVGIVDDILPMTYCDFLQCLFLVIGVVIITIFTNFYVLAFVVPLCVLFLFLRWFYLVTGRRLKRIEAISRSPVFSHITTTLQGLTTIRSAKCEKTFEISYYQHQNAQTRAYFTVIACSRWFASRLDWLCGIFFVLVSFAALIVGKTVHMDGGTVGLVLSSVLSLVGLFQWCVRQSAEIENNMVSVERVVEYTQLPQEACLEVRQRQAAFTICAGRCGGLCRFCCCYFVAPQELEVEVDTQLQSKYDTAKEALLEDKILSDGELAADWPMEGRVELCQVSLRYHSEAPWALRNVSLNVAPGEHLGIVGRTGAGKSSLVAAMLRWTELEEGSVCVDGVDVRRVGLHRLREKIALIPQEPVLFTGTLRMNLDPLGRRNDEELWRALEAVRLKTVVEELRAGLDSSVQESGTNFSAGQRQLLCLARALLTRNRVLIFDEATANVDPATDAVIQQTLRNTFSHCTVLCIAHRLHSVVEMHRVAVMSEGRVVECAAPHLLLQPGQQHQGAFLALLNHVGPEEAQNLKERARRAFEERNTNRDDKLEYAPGASDIVEADAPLKLDGAIC